MKAILTALIFCFTPALVIAQYWRLVTKEDRSWDGLFQKMVLLDSIVYRYSDLATRGSSRYLDTIQYDSFYVYSELGKQIGASVQTFSPNNDVLTRSDYRYVGQQQLSLSLIDSFIYSNGNLVRQVEYDSSLVSGVYVWRPRTKVEYTYNSQSQIESQTDHTWSSSNNRWEYTDLVVHFYDSAGQLERDSGAVSNANVFPAWLSSYQNKYSYDSAGRVMEKLSYYADTAGAFDTGSRVIYLYDNLGRLQSDSFQLYYQDSSWETVIYNRYLYNAAGDLITRAEVHINGYGTHVPWTYVRTREYTYNQLGLLVQYDIKGENKFGGLDFWFREVYNYEMYWPAGIGSKEGDNEEGLLLYPVPASGNLTISWNSSAEGPALFCIVDMTGRVVAQWTEKVQGSYAKQIYTGNMPVGSYLLIISSQGKRASGRFNVVR